jgi:hypothetical protein
MAGSATRRKQDLVPGGFCHDCSKCQVAVLSKVMYNYCSWNNYRPQAGNFAVRDKGVEIIIMPE